MESTFGRALLVAAVIILVVPPWIVSGQDTEEPPEPAFVLSSVEYRIEGRTRDWALKEVVELEEGLLFDSQESLDEHLSRQHQNLMNQRQLQSAIVRYDLEAVEDGPARVHVIVEVEDTWNIIVLPYFKYDSNDGLLLSLRGRDYNFFGTLQELSIDLDYLRTTEDTNEWTIAADFSLPFNMFERRWQWTLEEEFVLENDDIDFSTSTGIGYAFDLWRNPWEVGVEQGYQLYSGDKADEEGDEYFLTNEIYLTGDVGTPIPAGAMGYFRYRPDLSASVNYAFDETLSEERRGTFLGFDHALEAGGHDWLGNFRNGMEVALGNDNSYSFYRNEWGNKLTGSAKGWLARDPFGLSARTTGFYYLDGVPDDQTDGAEDIRGVLNDEMVGDIGLFLNTDVALKVWTLEPIFEMQWAAFFDVAYVTDTEGSFDEENDLRYGAGIEIIGFPLFARSLYLRGSLGFDVKRIVDGASWTSGDVREIFIGLGHHY
ncbi:MAG: hypothetical protein ACLFPP_08945 [Spirochaetaceae bacterium]